MSSERTTVCVSRPVLPPYTASPAYTADRLLTPSASADVDVVATPDALSATVASGTAPLRNCTLPVGTPAAPLTVAVSVTLWPSVDGSGADASVVVLVAMTTVSWNVASVVSPQLSV